MSRRLFALFRLILCAIALICFQNCSFTDGGLKPGGQNHSEEQLLGGDGYPGKVYANHGDCGDDRIQLKSLIRESSPDTFMVARQNCQDLPAPIPVKGDLLRYSAYDRTVFLHGRDVFDEKRSTPSLNKLTTALCHGGPAHPGLEVMIWYNSQTLDSQPDPRLANELFGRVYLSDSHSTETLSISPPEVFTDKLIYRSPPSAPPFELIAKRGGAGSVLRFTDQGANHEVSVTCFAQATPRHLEPNQGYFLELAPELAAGKTRFAVVSHVNNLDLFKKIDESPPMEDSNTLEGWSAGYLSIGGKVYEMRKKADGSICLGPGEDPRADCVMKVLGSIRSEDFPTLFANQNRFAGILTKSLQRQILELPLEQPMTDSGKMVASYYENCGVSAPYPFHIHYWRTALTVQLASEVLVHLSDFTQHRRLRTALIQAVDALITHMPQELLQFPTWDCRPENIELGALILRALDSAYVATGHLTIKDYIPTKATQIHREIKAVQTISSGYSARTKLAPLLTLMTIAERMGASSYDAEFARFAVAEILESQVLEADQATCRDTFLVFGGWKWHTSGTCAQERLTSEKFVSGLMELHSFLSARELCSSAGSGTLCPEIERSVLAFLAFHRNFPGSGVIDLNANATAERKVRFIPRLFGYAYSMGLKNTDLVPIGFESSQRMSLSELRQELITNSPILNDYQTTLMSYGLLQSRLSELTAQQ